MRQSGHALDWDTKPLPFKVYPALEQIRLPTDLAALGIDTFAALAPADPDAPAALLDLERLAALLFFSAGVTRVKTYPGGAQIHFRAAASTGALYQTEAYVVAGAVEGLAPGVYHFSPGDFSLRRLRAGDFRGAVALATADDAVAEQPASLILSAIYWRNTWKYQARGYRHLFWDSGTLLGQLLAVARALDVPARLVTGFVDAQLNGLLGLDAVKEGALVAVPLGAPGPVAAASPVITPLAPEVIPLSAREVDYPVLRDAYDNASLDSEAEVADWGQVLNYDIPPASSPPNVVIQDLTPPRGVAGRSLGETIAKRGSTRAFSGEAITAEALSSALFHATRGFPADVPAGLVDLYVNVHAVTGIEPGAYAYDRAAPRARPAAGRGCARGLRLPVPRAGAGRDVERDRLLPGRPGPRPRALGQSRLPAGEPGSGADRRAPLPGRVRSALRGQRADLLRPRGGRVLLAARRGQGRDLRHRPRPLRPDPRTRPASRFA